MKTLQKILTCLLLCFFFNTYAQPWYGTVYADADILKSSEKNFYKNSSYIGIKPNYVWDYRTNKFQTKDSYTFRISYTDGLTTNAIVNLEFGSVEEAKKQSEKYGRYAGLLPHFFRKDIKELELHKGSTSIGAGSGAITIHTGRAEEGIRRGTFEETMIHEAAHLTLGNKHKTTAWKNAQIADQQFISTYAQENPTTEDISESILPWIALRYRSDRISQKTINYIQKTIPHRIAYFDQQNFNLGSLMTGTPTTTPSIGCNPPKTILAETITDSSATITWSANGTSQFYLYYRNENGNWKKANDNVIPNTNFILKNLTASTKYEVDIYSICPGNKAPVSQRYTFVTQANQACLAPTHIKAKSITSSSATIHWSSNQDGPFYLYYKKEGNSWKRASRTAIKNTFFELHNLSANSNYQIVLYTTCNEKYVESKRFYFNTKKNDCTSPTNITIEGGDATSAILGWDKTNVTNYLVYYTERASNHWKLFTNSLKTNTINISGLKPGTLYDVDIYALCPSGYTNAKRFSFVTSGAKKSLTPKTSNFEVVLHPVPASSQLTIKLESPTNTTISIFDLNGRLVISQNIRNKKTTTLDVSSLSKGLYTLVALNHTGKKVKKFTLQ